MEIKLFDSELKVMEVLWDRGDTSAKTLAAILGKTVGWSKTTTYTVIKKCLDKGALLREEPNFICRAAVTREQTRQFETAELVNRLFGGREDQLIASLLGNNALTPEDIDKLRQIVQEMGNTT